MACFGWGALYWLRRWCAACLGLSRHSDELTVTSGGKRQSREVDPTAQGRRSLPRHFFNTRHLADVGTVAIRMNTQLTRSLFGGAAASGQQASLAVVVSLHRQCGMPPTRVTSPFFRQVLASFAMTVATKPPIARANLNARASNHASVRAQPRCVCVSHR